MAMRQPVRIGLTGGLGAGKSLVLRLLQARGIPTLQTDAVGHHLLQDKKVVRELARRFGRGILTPAGQVDRAKLAHEVFCHPRKRKVLNGFLHPAIRRRVAHWVLAQSRKRSRPALVVVEVPLLFEGGYFRWFDGALCVSAPRAIREKRLARRGWDPSEIRRREKSQWPQARKAEAADWVIFNRGPLKSLKYAVDEWLVEMRSERMNPSKFSRPVKSA